MKSQKTIESKNFDNKVLDFILAWDKAFPGKQYFNKLHFVMMHLPEFVEEYGICGRVSAESHESVHTMMARSKDAMKRMASTKQKYRTLFARATANLKRGIVESKAKYDKKTKRGKRQKTYNTNKNRKQQDQITFSSAIFAGTEIVNDEGFLVLSDCQGRISSKYRDQFLYVKTGRAPDDWVDCFLQTQLLSDAKLEQSKHAAH